MSTASPWQAQMKQRGSFLSFAVNSVWYVMAWRERGERNRQRDRERDREETDRERKNHIYS